MIINENDFRKLPFRGKMVRILSRMNHPQEGDTIPALYNDLMEYVAKGRADQSIPVLFPYIVRLAVETGSYHFVNIAANMKIRVLQRMNLKQLSETELRNYLKALQELRDILPTVSTGEHHTWPRQFKTQYLLNLLYLHSYSPQTLVLAMNGDFRQPLRVRCPHCGDDVQELHLNLSDLEETEGITPAPIPPTWDYMSGDSLYITGMTLAKSFRERKYIEVLPYLYGSFQCDFCDEEANVMEAMELFLREKENYFIPDEEFLLACALVSHQMTDAYEYWNMMNFVASQYRSLYGRNSLEAMHFQLQGTKRLEQRLRPNTFHRLMGETEQLIQEGKMNNPFYVRLTYWMAHYYGNVLDSVQNQDYYDRAEVYYNRVFGFINGSEGQNDEFRREVEISHTIFLCRSCPTNMESTLIDCYGQLDEEKDSLYMELIEELLKDYYRRKGDLPTLVAYQKILMIRIEENYGFYSERMATYLMDMGDIFREQEDLFNATASYEQALDIRARRMGNFYALPKSLAAYSRGTTAMTDMKKKTVRVQGELCSDTLRTLAELNLAQGFEEESLEYYEKAVDILEWISVMPFVLYGDAYLSLAEAYIRIGKGSMGKKYAKKAVHSYQLQDKDHASLPKAKELAGIED